MSATVWTAAKGKITMGGRRKLRVDALFSDAAPGIALHVGQFFDLEASKDKEQIDMSCGWRPYAIATGASVGPVFYDLDQASEYAVSVAALTDWSKQTITLPRALYAKLMRLWYPAAGKKLTAAMKRELAKLEAEPEGVANA